MKIFFVLLSAVFLLSQCITSGDLTPLGNNSGTEIVIPPDSDLAKDIAGKTKVAPVDYPPTEQAISVTSVSSNSKSISILPDPVGGYMTGFRISKAYKIRINHVKWTGLSIADGITSVCTAVYALEGFYRIGTACGHRGNINQGSIIDIESQDLQEMLTVTFFHETDIVDWINQASRYFFSAPIHIFYP